MYFVSEDFDVNLFIQRVDEELKAQKNSRRKMLIALGMGSNQFAQWQKGRKPFTTTVNAIANYLGVTAEYLKGETDTKTTDDFGFIDIPIIGEVAAGYDKLINEDFAGDTIPVHSSYLRGHSASEFFVLTITGQSMFPQFCEGDKILVQKCDALPHSNMLGVIRYEDDSVTIKNVEFGIDDNGDYLILRPTNPNFPPETIRGEDLEHCQVIGMPRMSIREF